MNVRFLTTIGAHALRERYGDALARDDAEALAATADARVLACNALAPATQSLLESAGVTIARTDGTVLLAASRAALSAPSHARRATTSARSSRRRLPR